MHLRCCISGDYKHVVAQVDQGQDRILPCGLAAITIIQRRAGSTKRDLTTATLDDHAVKSRW